MKTKESSRKKQTKHFLITEFKGQPINQKKQTAVQSEITYVLQTGEYHRTRNIKVTGDSKIISKLYVENIIPEYNSPNIEVWKDGECIGVFHEVEKVESKVKKAITKIAMEID